MKTLIEKIKDILYNVSDYIIMFTIILTIALIIGWRLDILFPQNTTMIETNKSSEQEEPQSKLVEKPETPSEVTPVEEEPEVTPVEEEPVKITVSIPEESDSTTIGNILLDNNLIDSVEEFDDKVKELELAESLSPGEYAIEKGSSLEEIIKIIANKE